MKLATRSALAILAFTAVSAFAESSQLKIAGDLMIHPEQMGNFFGIAADKVKNSAVWNWPEIHFNKPYKTAWTQVQARGPFDVSLSTENLNAQEVGFELNWTNPALSIGQFQIDDTIVREVGGVRIIIHLSGQCTGMSMNIPQGQWKVKGRMSWAWGAGGLQITWRDFQFSMNGAAVPQADLGNCQGPAGLQPALQQAFDAISHDQSWLQDVLRDGILDWVQSSLGGLQAELIKPRTLPIKPGLDLTWQPDGLAGMPGGLVRVAGHLLLQKNTAVKFEQSIERSYAESSLAQVKESGYVLPKDSLQLLIDFLYRTGDLQYRVTSDQVDSFSSLMQSRFLQFFVWPDLMNFDKNATFYFDVATKSAPVLSKGQMLSTSGVQYDLQAPLVVHQWAPADGKYLPYIDFLGDLSGKLQATVEDQKLVLQMIPDGLNLASLFRDEFAATRNVNSWMATSLLGSRVQSYLSSKPFSLDLPAWSMGDGLTLSVRDVQQWKQSFRVPLQFKKSK